MQEEAGSWCLGTSDESDLSEEMGYLFHVIMSPKIHHFKGGRQWQKIIFYYGK